jgi:hypothetical protein
MDALVSSKKTNSILTGMTMMLLTAHPDCSSPKPYSFTHLLPYNAPTRKNPTKFAKFCKKLAKFVKSEKIRKISEKTRKISLRLVGLGATKPSSRRRNAALLLTMLTPTPSRPPSRRLQLNPEEALHRHGCSRASTNPRAPTPAWRSRALMSCN